MHPQHVAQSGLSQLRKLALLGAALMISMLAIAASDNSKAEAAWYDGVGFCNASSTHGYNVLLYQGQRCVETHSIRAGLMAVTNAPTYNSPGAVINGCVVGKQYSGGTGGNVYPLACANIFPGDTVWGQTVDSYAQAPSWPTIINNSSWSMQVWMHGNWWGWWPA
jgi:hypothetical protein